ncbi:MAG TPA: hypothetical protein VK864_13160 [Longimicrobiales bacterium]|nr:hypothetical protein [Longimicrobiales bacterium]
MTKVKELTKPEAQPGSIVVSERVHRLAGGAFDYEDLGEQTLKGPVD